MRSYRGPNTANRQPALDRRLGAPGRDAAAGSSRRGWRRAAPLEGHRQRHAASASSSATAPVALRGGRQRRPGPPLGRELEIADLLRFIRDRRIRNVVWITGDVHYCAAHHYDPARARFTEFDPFWEFVAGPLHAGTFGPNALDATFGPEVKFIGIPPGMKPNRPPSDGLQFFGTMKIAARTRAMTYRLHDLSGRSLYSVELEAR